MTGTRRYPIPQDTYSHMYAAYARARWNSPRMTQIIIDEIDNEILNNIRKLIDEDESENKPA